MSGYPAVLRTAVGLRKRPLKSVYRHRKLTEEMLEIFQQEAQKHADLLTYAELAQRSEMTIGTVRSLMARLIRDKRTGTVTIHIPVPRGTQMNESEEIGT